MNLSIVEYQDSHFQIWDSFVLHESGNGTLFHTRKFLSYHPKERFQDCSVLVYSEHQLVAVFLACRKGAKVYSHKGTSGGGPVVRKDCFTYKRASSIVQFLLDYFEGNIAGMLIPEDVFSSVNTNALRFALSRQMEEIASPSMFFDLKEDIEILNARLRTGIRSVQSQGDDYEFVKTDSPESFKEYYQVLKDNLRKHNAEPVHDLEELLRLRTILGQDQFLFLALYQGRIVAGLWVLNVTEESWHTQYIARNYQQENAYVLPALILNLAGMAKLENKRILSIGSCNSGEQSEFSEDLCRFKEKLGAQMCFRYYYKEIKELSVPANG